MISNEKLAKHAKRGRRTTDKPFRAKQICKEQDEQICKSDIMKRYHCGPDVADLVYQYKGWIPLTKQEVARKSAANRKKKDNPDALKIDQTMYRPNGKNWLTVEWVA